MTQAIIIDDLPHSRAALRADLKDYCPQVEVIGEADGVISGAKLLKDTEPDIVFLDIQMNDGTGFDLLEILPEKNFKLIFTTASNEHAIRAFRFSAVDYLLKPIDPLLLQEAVKKASRGQRERIATLKSHLEGHSQRLVLNSQDKVRVVEIAEIIQCESNGSYTIFFLKDGEQVLVTKTLKEFDDLLSPAGFIRAHQSHLVNLSHIREFVKSDGGMLVMKDKTQIPVASRKRASVVAALEELGIG
jgi:two-component system LytT family response regulator